jgi:hypothetical protein
MNTVDNQDLHRYLDDEMTTGERAQWQQELARDNELREQLEGMRSLGHLLRQEYAAERPLPHEDFFRAQLMRRIQEEPGLVDKRGWRLPAFLSWLNQPWGAALAGAAACALILMPFLKVGENQMQQNVANIVTQSAYVPLPDGSAEGFYHKDASATIVVISGLPELPRDSQIGGFRFSVPDELRGKLPGTSGSDGPILPVADQPVTAGNFHEVAFRLTDNQSNP